jgi:hypothetical protein
MSWKLINNRMLTVAEGGVEGVGCQFDGDVTAESFRTSGCPKIKFVFEVQGVRY